MRFFFCGLSVVKNKKKINGLVNDTFHYSESGTNHLGVAIFHYFYWVTMCHLTTVTRSMSNWRYFEIRAFDSYFRNPPNYRKFILSNIHYPDETIKIHVKTFLWLYLGPKKAEMSLKTKKCTLF